MGPCSRRLNRNCWLIFLVVLFSPIFLHVYYRLFLSNSPGASKSEPIVIRPGFKIVSSFSLPLPMIMKPVDEMATMKWLKDLADDLAHRNSKQVYLQVVSEKSYEAFLNWLIAFKNTGIDLKKVLVVAVCEHVFNAITIRGISTVLVRPQWVIQHSALLKLSKKRPSWNLRILHQTVLRLLNYWRYDVIVIDTDAILLRNPRRLFEKYPDSDIIGSYSLETIVNYPYRNVWSLCTRVAMFKGNPSLNRLWKMNSNMTNDVWNDQTQMNHAIHSLKPQWSAEGGCDPPSLHCDMTGVTSTGLTVTLLSHDLICRYCDPLKRNSYYIWHKFGRQSKEKNRKAAKTGKVWYLRKDWKEIDKYSYSKGVMWLRQLEY